MSAKRAVKSDQGSRYDRIIERIFMERYSPGVEEIPFEREDIARVAQELGIELPKNLGDIIYSFRYRSALPEPIRERAPEGKQWIIRPAGRARYCFVTVQRANIDWSAVHGERFDRAV